jgi:NADH-quinone oxidoreductase subunit L
VVFILYNFNNMQLTLLCALVPLFPLIGFLVNGLGFRKIPNSAAGVISVASAAASFVVSLLLFSAFSSGNSQPFTAVLFEWATVGSLKIQFSYLIDQLSLLMLMVVTGVGTLIHIYSVGYMYHDEGFGKFMAFLNLFMFSMLLLVMGSNYVIMFFGWEGVGLCSYLLIGFWNKNVKYADAARKAFVMNRIGDLGFLVGIFLLISNFGTIEYSEVFPKAIEMFKIGDSTMFWITFCLFIGAMGKSAQIPLYTWLPDAMAGPTPVSALIHAATMVTAGIYMIIRSNALYTLAPETLQIVGIIGLTTALFAASIGLFQNDIKKVLAYSTVSQLGYMFLALGVMAYSSALFHVMTHAFFKALLFLGAGSVIHAMGDEQDIRKMGGLQGKLKITFYTFLIATIAISGIPPFAGFFSKDEILMHVFEHNKIMWALGVVGSMMTSFYMFRLLFLTFFGKFRGTKHQEEHLHESPISMTLPLMILSVLSVFGGFIGLPEVFAKSWLAEFMLPLFTLSKSINPAVASASTLSHSTEYMLMGVSVAAALISMGAAWFIYSKESNIPAKDEQIEGIQKLVYNKYYIDELYDTTIVKPLYAFSEFLHSVAETALDMLVDGVGKLVLGSSEIIRKLQSGLVPHYITMMVIGMIAFLLFTFRGILF